MNRNKRYYDVAERDKILGDLTKMSGDITLISRDITSGEMTFGRLVQ